MLTAVTNAISCSLAPNKVPILMKEPSTPSGSAPISAPLLLVAVCRAYSLMKALSAPQSFLQGSHQRRPGSAHGGLYSAAAHSAVGAVQLPLAPMWILGAVLVNRRSKHAQHKQDLFFE